MHQPFGKAPLTYLVEGFECRSRDECHGDLGRGTVQQYLDPSDVGVQNDDAHLASEDWSSSSSHYEPATAHSGLGDPSAALHGSYADEGLVACPQALRFENCFREDPPERMD